MTMPVKISGFTIVRNALKLNYPFRESVLSVLPLCDEFILNCGDSEDRTRELCAELAAEHPKIRVIDSIWTREKQSGGYQLKHQTDTALAQCTGDWCLYIQADEVMHEADFAPLRQGIQKANPMDHVDGLVSNYLHFYGGYNYHIQGRNWYRREVRLFKNGRGITAFRDAQGFRRDERRLRGLLTSARIFHYGYVRSPQSLATKSQEMAGWWGENPDSNPDSFALRRHVGLRRYKGTHPAVMADRIAHTPQFDPAQWSRKWDRNEFKNALTLAWESIVPYRIGEFRNYDLVR